jgi:6-phosphogluconate dehydrogenase
VITYTQGMALLQEASKDKDYGLNLGDIARIWRGGCIIRSALLEEIRSAYAANAELPSLLLDESFAGMLSSHSSSLRKTVASFVAHGVPSLCFSSVLAYFDAFTTERLPANLIQAQRDHFGAHTYQRVDKEGTFHTSDW